QEAWKKLRFSAKATMRLAQTLYEKGLITYHRTDSLNLSDQSLFVAKKLISESYGTEYWAGFFRKYKAKGKTQEAHEAIRPAYPDKTPDNIKGEIEERELRLYDLIWKRFVASQMAPAVFDSTTIDINAKNYTFRTNGQILKFAGFLKVYSIKFEENDLPPLEEKEFLKLIKLSPEQHFTQPPARYTEASLIKALEEEGIGRPSTYAPILSTIQDRNYVEKNAEKRFAPTEIGITVNNILVEHFPKVVDVKFTAKMEEDLDEIALGEKKWEEVIGGFYSEFAENLEHKYQEVSKKNMTETTDKICPKCGKNLIIRFGKFGKFYACSGFPECKYTETLEQNKLNIKCPKCIAGDVVERKTKRGKIFYGCSRWPDCDFASWNKITDKKCPRCKSLLAEVKKDKFKCTNEKCDYAN
ncbi:MAG: DNA topoisomerase, partial [bacterium]